MNVSLTPQLELYVKDKVKSGLYNSSSEVVREALRLMGERDKLRQTRIEELRAEIHNGVRQIERGQYLEGDEVFRLLRERNADNRENLDRG